MILNFMVPEGAANLRLKSDGASIEPNTYHEENHDIAWDSLEILPGEVSVATLTYEIEGAAEVEDGGSFKMTLFPQTLVNPDRYSFEIEGPYGFAFDDGIDDPTTSYVAQGVLERPRLIDLRLVEN